MIYFSKNRVYLSEELYYTIYRVKNRVIYAPCPELKKIQRYIKNAIKWTFPFNCSTAECAEKHTGSKWVMKLDIKNFYDSVPQKFTQKVIEKSGEKIKFADTTNLFKMVTLEGKLPTGAPSSSHIANASFTPVERRIRYYCESFGVNYSRYVDDMTFSGDDKVYLKKVEKYVRETLKIFGYELNEAKTKYISRNKQQNVLGLVANNKNVRISKKERKRIRAMLHSYILFNSNKQLTQKHRCWDCKREAKLKGYLSYIKSVDKITHEQLNKYSNQLKERYGCDS